MKKYLFILFAGAVIAGLVFLLLTDKDKKTEPPDAVTAESTEKIIQVPAICQYPELPTGCESAAAAMVLQYYGMNITPEEFAERWLPCSERFYSVNNALYGPDPNETFAGNPFSENAYGCYSAVIVKAVNGNCTECRAEKIADKTLPELCKEYIDRNEPIMIWATMGMKESRKGKTWYLQDGSVFTWISGEHCLVLVGYNENYYFLNDPQSGSTAAYEKDIVERRFGELGSQAVYICKK